MTQVGEGTSPPFEIPVFAPERDEANLEALKAEVAKMGDLPEKVLIEPHAKDCFTTLEKMVQSLSGKRMAPAFVFVDPYGFKVPGALLRELMRAGRVELFVNVIWRELDMAIAQARNGKAGFVKIVNEMFDGEDWRERIASEDFDERADQAADLLAEKVNAKWLTHLRMIGDNGRTRYMLLHLTNHPAGRVLMKDCMWKVCPDAEGGFHARKGSQQLLITPTPDLEPLRQWVLEKINGGGMRWQELHQAALEEIWRIPQVNDMVRRLKRQGVIGVNDCAGGFFPKSNPLLLRLK